MPSSTSRVGLLSDTHGALDDGIAEHLARCDLLVHAGDVGGGTVLHRLATLAPRVVAVRGNNDTAAKWADADQAVLAALPVLVRVRLPGGDLVVEHGDDHPARSRHARLRARHAGARAVVCGHSHRLAIDRDETPWVLNPGAAGHARTFGGASCLLLRIAAGEWNVEAVRMARPVRRRR